MREAAITAPQNYKVSGSLALAETQDDEDVTPAAVQVPDYLEKTYWWAYVRPWAVHFFEREWLVNLILWGWYRPLRDAALKMWGDNLPGRTLQVACVYGDLTSRVNAKVEASGGHLDVVDVVTAQLENLEAKLPKGSKVGRFHMDSSNMDLPDAFYDRAIMFFLMHEQPYEIRLKTISEAFRVVKPGGSVMIVEFNKPKWWHPLRYMYLPFLKFFEPFAPDVWGHDGVSYWLPKPWCDRIVQRRTLFGGFYQVLTIRA